MVRMFETRPGKPKPTTGSNKGNGDNKSSSKNTAKNQKPPKNK